MKLPVPVEELFGTVKLLALAVRLATKLRFALGMTGRATDGTAVLGPVGESVTRIRRRAHGHTGTTICRAATGGGATSRRGGTGGIGIIANSGALGD